MYVQEGDLEGLFDLRDNDIESHAPSAAVRRD